MPVPARVSATDPTSGASLPNMLESLFDAALVRIRPVARKHSPSLNAPRMAIDSPSLNPASSMAGICAAGFMRRNSAVRVFVPGAAGQNWKGTLLMRQGQTTARTGCDTGTPNIFSMMMPVSKQPVAVRRRVGEAYPGTACAGSGSLRTDVVSNLGLDWQGWKGAWLGQEGRGQSRRLCKTRLSTRCPRHHLQWPCSCC